MYRKALAELLRWRRAANRKPLVIRGARQVGKTWLVREFARQYYDDLVEINFDRDAEKLQLVVGHDIDRSLQLLELDAGTAIRPGKTLLFFDEIQAVPELLPRLRYFHEERPDIHVMAAGSLLEFLLSEHDFSMPVGRVEYLHLGPMDIEEFMLATGGERFVDFLRNFSLSDGIPESVHREMMYFVKMFWVVGGMPAAVGVCAASGDIAGAVREHESILQAYEDDFGRYRRRIYPPRLRKVFTRIPALVGKKLKYVRIDPAEKSRDLANCLELLELARVLYRVRHSSGNGVPLAAEAKDRDFKPLFLDTGLVSSSLGLNLPALETVGDLLLVNNGALAEQFIGQHLLYAGQGRRRPELYYWNREKKSSSAELDYLISVDDRVIPVEVKSGSTGSLKSLHLFLAEKKLPTGLRFHGMPPACERLETGLPGKERHPFLLVSLPLYLVGQTERLLRSARRD